MSRMSLPAPSVLLLLRGTDQQRTGSGLTSQALKPPPQARTCRSRQPLQVCFPEVTDSLLAAAHCLCAGTRWPACCNACS